MQKTIPFLYFLYNSMAHHRDTANAGNGVFMPLRETFCRSTLPGHGVDIPKALGEV
jgi:hypothetical protein